MASKSNAPDHPWPVPAGTPAIEVYYALVSHPARPLAFWHRYTLLSTRDGHREARLWAALTDGEGGGRSFFATERLSLEAACFSEGTFALDLGERARLTDCGASGRIATPRGEARWELAWDTDPVVFTPIGHPWLTEALVRGVGVTRHRSVRGAVRVRGRLVLDGEELVLEDAPGHQGHTAGRSMAPAWRWVQCNGFEDPSLAVEALGVGPVTSCLLREGGRVHRLNLLPQLIGPRRTRGSHAPGRWRFTGDTRGLRLGGGRSEEEALRFTVEVVVDEPALWQTVIYLAPDGSRRYNAHCSLARVELVLERRGRAPERHVSRAGRVEWVGREPPVPGDYRPRDFTV